MLQRGNTNADSHRGRPVGGTAPHSRGCRLAARRGHLGTATAGGRQRAASPGLAVSGPGSREPIRANRARRTRRRDPPAGPWHPSITSSTQPAAPASTASPTSTAVAAIPARSLRPGLGPRRLVPGRARLVRLGYARAGRAGTRYAEAGRAGARRAVAGYARASAAQLAHLPPEYGGIDPSAASAFPCSGQCGHEIRRTDPGLPEELRPCDVCGTHWTLQ